MVRLLLFLFFLSISLLHATPELSGDLGGKYELSVAGNLQTIINTVAPLCDAALLIGEDGTSVLIPAYAFKQVTLSVQYGKWNSVAPLLPPVAKIRNIQEICLQQIPAKYSINIQNSQRTIVVSPFQFILSQYKFLGDSSKNGYLLSKYKLKSGKNSFNMLTAITATDKLIFTSGEDDLFVNLPMPIELSQYYFHIADDTLKTIIQRKDVK